MTDYTVRVVLKGNATWSDYDKLHKAMAARGFVDEITGSDGTVYKLPGAEYAYSGALTLDQVHTKAKAAADSVWTNNSALVTQSSGRQWSGLDIVRQARRA